MSKADELSKKMKPSFTPRQSVAVRPLPTTPVESAPAPSKQPVADSPKKPAKTNVVSLFAKIPKEEKRWLDHHRIDTGKELGEIVTQAIQLLKKQVEKQ
jgi:hypothetical protein